ncbi:MAG: hypothetical protein AMXMBFR82_34230 [Candidatus Hydrogenedentota bacterium]
MSGKVVRRVEAKRDLIKHYVYLAEHADLETARRFLRATEEAFLLLAELPELGASRQFRNRQLAEVRMWPVKGFRKFLVFYIPIEGGVRIIRVIHSTEDYWRVLENAE